MSRQIRKPAGKHSRKELFLHALLDETRRCVIPNPVRFLNGVRNLLFLWFLAANRPLTRKRHGFGMTDVPFSHGLFSRAGTDADQQGMRQSHLKLLDIIIAFQIYFFNSEFRPIPLGLPPIRFRSFALNAPKPKNMQQITAPFSIPCALYKTIYRVTRFPATLTKTSGPIAHFPNWNPYDKAAIFKGKPKSISRIACKRSSTLTLDSCM